jgi:beta-glucosidase
MPDGKGELNRRGIDFYSRIIDLLLERGITPFITLYHWDMPSRLEETGGWISRDTAYHFADYTSTVARIFGDRVKHWITLNEPISISGSGYGSGEHAPGYRNPAKMFRSAHILLLAHGLAVRRIREEAPSSVGIANAFSPIYGQRDRDRHIVARIGAFLNRMFMDPIFYGRYPDKIRRLINFFNRKIKPEDFDIISEPVDFIGINHYSRFIARRTLLPYIGYRLLKPVYDNVVFTDMGWEIYG